MFKLCQCCKGWIATMMIQHIPVCRRCIPKMDSRLIAELRPSAEVAMLERMWNRKSAEVVNG